jgi:hypothetical protein
MATRAAELETNFDDPSFQDPRLMSAHRDEYLADEKAVIEAFLADNPTANPVMLEAYLAEHNIGTAFSRTKLVAVFTDMGLEGSGIRVSSSMSPTLKRQITSGILQKSKNAEVSDCFYALLELIAAKNQVSERDYQKIKSRLVRMQQSIEYDSKLESNYQHYLKKLLLIGSRAHSHLETKKMIVRAFRQIDEKFADSMRNDRVSAAITKLSAIFEEGPPADGQRALERLKVAYTPPGKPF